MIFKKTWTLAWRSPVIAAQFRHKKSSKIGTFSTQKIGKKWDQSGRKSSLKIAIILAQKFAKNKANVHAKNWQKNVNLGTKIWNKFG